jgi:hypothetical protein
MLTKNGRIIKFLGYYFNYFPEQLTLTYLNHYINKVKTICFSKIMMNMEKQMKKFMITIAFVLFVPVTFSFACEEGYYQVNISDIQGKNWHLTEVKRGYDVIAAIDRTDVPRDIYTIRFEADRLAGVGAPNTYFAAYSIGEDYDLSIWGVSSTRVSPIFQMKAFSENEYFKCLKSTAVWYRLGENLVLYTYPEGDYDNPIILVFS